MNQVGRVAAGSLDDKGEDVLIMAADDCEGRGWEVRREERRDAHKGSKRYCSEGTEDNFPCSDRSTINNDATRLVDL